MYSFVVHDGYEIYVAGLMLLIELIMLIKTVRIPRFGDIERRIVIVLGWGIICAVSDMLSVVLPGHAGKTVLFLVNTGFHCAVTAISFRLAIFRELRVAKVTKLREWAMCIPAAVFFFLSITNYWTGWLFSFDDALHYHRGALFLPAYLMLWAAYCGGVLALTIIRLGMPKYHGKRKMLIRTMVYTTVMMTGLIAQNLYPGLPLSNMGFVITFLLVFVDNQERLHYEEIERDRLANDLIRQTLREKEFAYEEAKRASAAKTEFLFNMSHDLLTPMNAVIGYAHLAKSHIDDVPAVQDNLKNIMYSGKYLEELIGEILTMSSIEAGRDELNPQEYLGDDMVDQTVSIIRREADKKQIELVVDNSGIRHRRLRGDHAKVRRIVFNILNNAVKFTPEGGRVEVIFGEKESSKEGYACFTFIVRDNGIGMSREFVSNIFDAFSREQTSTVSGQKGAGLGMAIVKRYVDLMGGKITIDSTPGKGTTVQVETDFEIIEEEREDVAAGSRIAGKSILVVEDNKLNRNMVKIILTDMGAHVDTVENGKQAVEALEQCRDNAYDLVLMDIQMPVMDGVSATEAIRASDRPYLRTLPIVALTANTLLEDVKRYYACGMNACIAKPIDPEKIEAELAEFI